MRQVDLLPDDLVHESATCRLVALRMLRYANASGFGQVHALALAFANNRMKAAIRLADQMFAVVSARELLTYAAQCAAQDAAAGGAA